MDLMWLFTVPVLLVAIKTAVSLAAIFLLIQVIRWGIQSKPPNPFSLDARLIRKPYELDPKKRDAVLKQGFAKSKVPDELDAIVIGSGIGGLTCAAILAKAGKKVLVLEQHDQAGGCCHTFVEKGYEFDVGIHYIGEMGSQTINKTLVDQITRGQLEWAVLEDQYDVVSIGYGENNRKYPVTAGSEKWVELLKSQFPGEEAAIDKYLELIMSCRKSTYFHVLLKLLPLWLVQLVLYSGVLKVVTNFLSSVYTSTTLHVVEELTHNKDLQTVLMYCFGDYGTAPDKSPFIMQAILSRHFLRDGGHYPVGGASEIAFNIIPVIESSGGRVLVRADVESILTRGRNQKICGVRVKKGTETHEIFAPMVISSAGVYNTFQTLLPKEIAKKSYYTKIAGDLKPGVGAMNVFLGLDASAEDLGLKAQNHWAFTTSDITGSGNDYMAMAQEEILDHPQIPLLFVSFPSAKDPNWTLHEERKGKSTCAIVTLASWEWFNQWQDAPVKKRGDDYDEVKKTLGDKMIEQTCQLFPQIRDHIDFTDIGTPVTNKFYIGQPHGEIYGLDHTMDRFSPDLVAKLRPQTDLDGLYLTGQDVLSCGFTGALFAGLITAQIPHARFAEYRNDDLVNSHLEFVDRVQNKAQRILLQVKAALDKTGNTGLDQVFVGIHVRRGDWEQHFWEFNKRNITTVDESYFHDAMSYYRAKFTRVAFLIVSDDMPWCKQTFAAPDIFYAGGNSPPVDMCVLSACNHSVVSHGTFGVWGAFLAGGEVVVPTRGNKKCKGAYQVQMYPQIRVITSRRYLFSCRDLSNFEAEKN